MPRYSIPFPATFRIDEDDAGIVHDYLSAKGYAVEGVSINMKDKRIEIDAATDPTVEVTNYQPPLSPKQKAKAALAELNSIDIDAAPLADLRRALKLMRGLMNYDLRTP
jgi:hypothetical protein